MLNLNLITFNSNHFYNTRSSVMTRRATITNLYKEEENWIFKILVSAPIFYLVSSNDYY
jgi:superfamily I DNA and/or RNA helicase